MNVKHQIPSTQMSADVHLSTVKPAGMNSHSGLEQQSIIQEADVNSSKLFSGDLICTSAAALQYCCPLW